MKNYKVLKIRKTVSIMFRRGLWTILSLVFISASQAKINQMNKNNLYTYTLSEKNSPAETYDEAAAVASIQGIINKDGPYLYILSSMQNTPEYWLNIFTNKNEWLSQKNITVISDLDSLVKLAGGKLKGAVIWDPKVPASFNVATTIAGIENAVILSPELEKKYLKKWKTKIIEDLRGRFDGSITGSKKNDAYRWAIDKYLKNGKCSSHLLCLYEDSATARGKGDTGYVITRDWAVKNRAFVFDLSVWADEMPKDDPKQKLGTDLVTYKMILDAVSKQADGNHMTELAGFFSFWKYSNISGYPSKHDPVPTEWETVFLISPYNVYQNTVAGSCYNQSLHSQMPFKRLIQKRPVAKTKLEKKIYICILMADYDSTTPLYEFLPKFWDDKNRGKIPLLWGINPNLLETYPDIITHYYKTATKNDFFASDASAAGYMNPSRIKSKYISLFIKHNKKFFEMADMSIAPMVLDWNIPSKTVKNAFTKFAPDGYATIITDFHDKNAVGINKPYVWKDMPVMELINSVYSADPEVRADLYYNAIKKRSGISPPDFYIFRIVWDSPSNVIKSFDILRKNHPELNFEVIDAYNFFGLFKKHWKRHKRNKKYRLSY